MDSLVLLLVSTIAGVVFGFMVSTMFFRGERSNIYARGKSEGEKERAQLEERLNSIQTRINEVLEEKGQHTEAANKLREENALLKAAQADADARLETLRKQSEEKIALIQEAQVNLLENVRSGMGERIQALEGQLSEGESIRLENMALKAAQGNAAEAPASTMDALTQPILTALEKVGASVAELESSRGAAYSTLLEQIHELAAGQSELRRKTAGMFHALRAPVRGNWGEVQLRRVVELAGMVEHCDFENLPVHESADGIQRPDLVVHLPNRRLVAVEAKVPQQQFLEALELDGEARREKLSDHAAQLRVHVGYLASRPYRAQFSAEPEFIIAFLPSEPFFAAALEQDPELMEWGAVRGVLLATPATLIALLKSVCFGWQQNVLAGNAREISGLGHILYDRLLAFTGQLDDVRRGLQRTVDCYNKTAASLETSVLPAARRFQRLGAASGDTIFSPEPVDSVPRGLRALDEAVRVPFLAQPEPAATAESQPAGAIPEAPA